MLIRFRRSSLMRVLVKIIPQIQPLGYFVFLPRSSTNDLSI